MARGLLFRLGVAVICLTGCAASVPDSAPEAGGGGGPGLMGLFQDSGDAARDGGAALSAPDAQSRVGAPLTRAALAGGDVVVTEFEGYCIDAGSLVLRRERGFAMLASCKILSDGERGAAVAPVIATVTVGPRGRAADLPTPAALAASTDGTLLQGDSADNLVLARVTADGQSVPEGAGATHWRAAFVVSGRLVGMALYAPKDSPYAGASGGEMLRRLQGQVVSASTEEPPVAPPTRPEMAVPAQTGFLGRLFNR